MNGRKRHLAAGFLALAAACRETPFTPAERGDLVVLVAADESGEVVDATFHSAGDRPSSVEAPRGARVVAFTVPRASLRETGGIDLDDGTFGGLHVRPAGRAPFGPTEAGACGRCLAGDEPVTRIHPGDSCPIPTSARAVAVTPSEIDPATIARLGDGVRLEWPGACPCSEPVLAPDTSDPWMRFEPLAPVEQPWPHTSAVARPDGTTALLGLHSFDLVAPEGVRRLPNDLPTVEVAGASLGDGTIITAAFDPSVSSNLLHARFRVVPPSFDHVLEGPEIAMYVWNAVPSPSGDQVLLLGSTGSSPLVTSCAQSAAGAITCAPITSGLTGRDSDVSDVAFLPDGRAVFSEPSGALLVMESLPDPLRVRSIEHRSSEPGSARGVVELADGSEIAWRHDRAPVFDTAGSPVQVQFHGNGIGAIGSRLFGCAYSNGGTMVLTATVPARIFEPGAPGISWSVIGCRRNLTQCHAVVPAGPDEAIVSIDGDEHIRVHADGRFLDAAGPESACRPAFTPNAALPGIDRDLLWILDSRDGGAFAHAVDRSVFRRRPESTRFELVAGPARPLPAFGAIVRLEERLWAIGDGGALAIAADQGRILERASAAGFEAQDRVIAAAVDRARGAILVAGHDKGASWLARILAAERSGASVPSERIAVPSDAGRPVDLAELGPGRFGVVFDQGRVFHLAGDHLEEIPIEWDDPATRERESAPDLRACQRLRIRDEGRSSRDQPSPLRSIDVAAGIGWVAGCQGIVLRVDFDAEPRRAQRIAWARSDLTPTDPPSGLELSSVRAICADAALLAGSGEQARIREQGRFIRVERDGAGFVFRSIPGVESPNGVSTRPSSGWPVELVADEHGSLAVFAMQFHGFVHSVPGIGRFYLPARLLSAARGPGGEVLIGGLHGRLLLGTPER